MDEMGRAGMTGGWTIGKIIAVTIVALLLLYALYDYVWVTLLRTEGN
jgi:hypothetical protein